MLEQQPVDIDLSAQRSLHPVSCDQFAVVESSNTVPEVRHDAALTERDMMIDLHADDVESDEEPPELTSDDSDDDSDDDVPDDALTRQDSVEHDSATSSTTDDTSTIDKVTATFQQSLEQGSKACISEAYQIAVGHYRAALTLLAKHSDLQYERAQLAVLLYAVGVSEFNLGSMKSVQDGMTHFQHIINEHEEIFHVLAYYGLSCAYCRQNRYLDALQPVEDGLMLIERDLVPMDCYWPGTETVVQEVSSAQTLKDRFEDLQFVCRTPPLPDAVCRFKACDGHFKRQIYLTDIDFKGFVSVHCQEKCIVEYHRDCWSRQKSTVLDVRLDKDVLNTNCLTPDCTGRIYRLRFYGPDGGILKELPAENQEHETKSKRTKQKPAKAHQATVSKSSVKKEKNMKDKTRVAEAGSQNSAAVDDSSKTAVDGSKNEKSKDPACAHGVSSQPSSDKNLSAAENPVPVLPTDGGNFVALQKKNLVEDSSDRHVEAKQKKARAKRERQRMQVYTGDFFKEPSPDSEPLAEDNYFSFGVSKKAEEMSGFGKPVKVETVRSTRNDYWDIPPANTYNPPSLSSVVGDGSRSAQTRSTPRKKPVPAKVSMQAATRNVVSTDVTSSLYALFASLLKNHGPMDPNDPVIQHELEMSSTEAQVAICEAGGISKFLRQSLQFAVVDVYVCLASDAGKARQLARSRRQALLHNQKPQAKLNPPPSVSLSASTVVSSAPPATKTSLSAYRSLAGMDLPLSFRVIPGLSQESISELSNVPTFLSQPEVSSSPVVQTAVHGCNNYNDSGIKRVNSDNTYDTWVTVSNVTKSSSDVTNHDITTSNAINELDDFLEPFTSENSSNIGKLTSNKGTVSNVTAKEEVVNQQAYYKQFKNVPETSGSDSSDESGADGSVDLSSSSESLDDQQYYQGDGSQMKDTRPVNNVDSLDTELVDTCASQNQQSSVALSVTAAEFTPLTFAANQPSMIASLGTSSPKMTTASRSSSQSRPSSRAAMMSNKRVQTDDSWASELQQLVDSHMMEVAGLQQQLSVTTSQLQQQEHIHDAEKLQLASSWKAEKLALEAELEKLRNELDFTKSNLERAYNVVVSTEGKLHENQQMLNEEREKSKALKLERDKLEQLVMVMKTSRAEASTPSNASFMPQPMMMGYRVPQSLPGHMFMMAPASHDNRMALLSNRLPQPPNAVANEPNWSVGRAGVMATKASSLVATTPRDAPAQSFILSAAAPTVGAGRSKQGLEKILDTLAKMFPDVRRTDLSRYVQEVRVSRSNSLSGLTVQQIVSLVKTVIVKNQMMQQQQQQQRGQWVPPAHTVASSVASAGSGSVFGDELFEEEENPCTVCLGELETGSTSKLDCGHVYHTECIRKWFREQSTCPTCRNYALLHDEFPTLHSASHAYR